MKIFLCLGLLLLSSLVEAQTVKYIHTDALGSIVAVTDANANIIERREYEPYGAQSSPVVQDGPGYTGHVQDAATGLTYMQQRYYDSSIERFLSVDPVLADGNTGGNFNRYRYAANNPYRFTDPDGRQEMAAERFGDSYGSWTPDERVPFEAVAVPATAALVAITPLVGPELALGLRVITRNVVEQPKLTGDQAKNLARFEKKFSKENRNVEVSHSKDGTVTFKNEVPGRVAGSKAVYEKTVDSSGKTTAATKTTYDPKGYSIHVKDKLK
ncbi:RHS repeat domain-containing protein [Xanthomonas hyacinthi]|nr:RHS repeat-associated core domain-containing protein [Xanthomonas hyacinthi]